MHAPTPSAVVPATTRTRPSTWRTTVSSTRTRSLSFMRPISLVTPSAVSPLTPAPMKRSMMRLSLSRCKIARRGKGRRQDGIHAFQLHGFLQGRLRVLCYCIREISMKSIVLLGLTAAAVYGQPIEIRVDAASTLGPYKSIYAYFGYDEPNYTYMKDGRKLIAELQALSPVPVQIRAHHLLVSGDGIPALKWGSTNAYTEDANGKPVYDWTIVDRIFDTYLQVKARPFVEIGFMPEALSTHPQPYPVNWPAKDGGTGWSYPPKDYLKWAELVRQWVLHSGARHGTAGARGGGGNEYNKLSDYTSDAVKRALPSSRVGGPGSTGPGGTKAAAFLKQFLEHCARGTRSEERR